MDDAVLEVLDKHSLLRTHTKLPGKVANRWLSPIAVDAKRKRRLMEKRWKMSKLEDDRAAYRTACRHANVTIMDRYRTYFRDKICDVLRLLVSDGTQSRDSFTRRPPLSRSQMETSKLSARGLLCFFFVGR